MIWRMMMKQQCTLAASACTKLAAALAIPVLSPDAPAIGAAAALPPARVRGRRSSKAHTHADKEGEGEHKGVLEEGTLGKLVAAVEALVHERNARSNDETGDARGAGMAGGDGGGGMLGSTSPVDKGRGEEEKRLGEKRVKEGEAREVEEEEARLSAELAKAHGELDKTKQLFSRAMVNAAALEMDIKKLQDAARVDKVRDTS